MHNGSPGEAGWGCAMSDWVSVDDSMPETQKMCIVAYCDYHGRERITMGWFAPAKTVDASDFSDEVDGEYDEEKDTYWLKEGWNDESQESEYHYGISGVTHWQPLPIHPSKEQS